MSIEKVHINTTLKAGKDVWDEGTVLTAPLPQAILDELYASTGTVSVIEGNQITNKSKMVYVAERVKETATSMTTMAVEPAPEPVSKPKPKLNRRRA